MKIHKAGINVILSFIIIEAVIFSIIYFLLAIPEITYVFGLLFLILTTFVVRFFRKPSRNISFSENQLIVPADGEVVVIEEILDEQFSGEKRIQVSIFMSVWNIHINWIPVIGKILSTQHFDGKFLLAKQPKSSIVNERSVTMIESNYCGSTIVVKQIAGVVARRIITYATKGSSSKAGEELGFIRFGSRVDVLVPTNTKIDVKIGQKVKGGINLLGELQR